MRRSAAANDCESGQKWSLIVPGCAHSAPKVRVLVARKQVRCPTQFPQCSLIQGVSFISTHRAAAQHAGASADIETDERHGLRSGDDFHAARLKAY